MHMKTKTRKPGKQRKKLYNTPHHRRGNVLSAHLSSELKESHNTRSIPVRTGDTVRVLRGDYKGFEGKILRVDRKNYRISIEGITREKADGTPVNVPVHASKVEVVRLNMGDKWRDRILKRKGAIKEAQKLEGEPSEKMGELKALEEPVETTSKVEGGK